MRFVTAFGAVTGLVALLSLIFPGGEALPSFLCCVRGWCSCEWLNGRFAITRGSREAAEKAPGILQERDSPGPSTPSLSLPPTHIPLRQSPRNLDASTSTTAGSLPAPVPPPLPTTYGATPICWHWYAIKNPDPRACERMLNIGRIDLVMLQALNPEVDANCTNLDVGFAYCLEGVVTGGQAAAETSAGTPEPGKRTASSCSGSWTAVRTTVTKTVFVTHTAKTDTGSETFSMTGVSTASGIQTASTNFVTATDRTSTQTILAMGESTTSAAILTIGGSTKPSVEPFMAKSTVIGGGQAGVASLIRHTFGGATFVSTSPGAGETPTSTLYVTSTSTSIQTVYATAQTSTSNTLQSTTQTNTPISMSTTTQMITSNSMSAPTQMSTSIPRYPDTLPSTWNWPDIASSLESVLDNAHTVY